MKTCSKCHTNKDIASFRHDSSRKDGLYPWCKDCERAYKPKKSTKEKGYWLAKDGYKICCKCKIKKETKDFYKNKSNPDKLGHYCKSCSKEAIKRSKAKNPENEKRRSKEAYLRRRHGLTLYKYYLYMMQQGEKCPICGQKLLSTYVDHDRNCCPGKSCGKCFKALLCYNCHKGLAYFKWDPDLTDRASNYLRS